MRVKQGQRKYFSYKNNELDHLDYICDVIKDKDFAERVDYYLRWYIYKARRAKTFYYFFNCATIILPLIVAFLNGYCKYRTNEIVNILVILLPLLVSLLTSIGILYRFLEKWNNCRYTISKANILLDRYIDSQKNEDFEKEKIKYHEEFSRIIIKENKNWKKIQKHREKNKNMN